MQRCIDATCSVVDCEPPVKVIELVLHELRLGAAETLPNVLPAVGILVDERDRLMPPQSHHRFRNTHAIVPETKRLCAAPRNTRIAQREGLIAAPVHGGRPEITCDHSDRRAKLRRADRPAEAMSGSESMKRLVQLTLRLQSGRIRGERAGLADDAEAGIAVAKDRMQ